MTSQNQHRQTLIRVSILDSAGQASSRFIDALLFDQWREQAQAKPGYEILKTQPCIWIPTNEQRRREPLFARRHQPTDVIKINMECYDAATATSEQRIRFVPAEQFDVVVNRLTDRLAHQGRYVTTEIDTGTAIVCLSHTALNRETFSPTAHIASSWSIPRGFAPVRSAIRS